MSENSSAPRSLPRVGMRNIKTATAAALCALVYFFLDRSPAFACIGAIFGMGSDLENSRLHGGNRLFGTLIGGLLGMALFRVYLIFYPNGGHSLLLVPLVFVGVGIFGACNKKGLYFSYEWSIDEETEGDSPASSGGASASSAEERLAELQRLYDQRLITAREFEEKRQEILRDL